MLSTEKLILRDLLDRGQSLATEVEQFLPTSVKNVVDERRIGKYCPVDRRVFATAQMDVIAQFQAKGLKPPAFLEARAREMLHFDPEDVRIGIVTPGGIAPGLNTVIHSIVSMHSTIYGMRTPACGFLGGFRGLAEERTIELTPETTRGWVHKGGTELGAGRGKWDIRQLTDKLIDSRLRILYVVGGDGSLSAAHLIAEETRRRNKKIVIAGVPKTMDNDVLWVWHSFGFDTAVEEASREINALHDEARSTGKVCLIPLFGRDAGFVAAHAALASGRVDVVLVPEVPFRMEEVLDYVQQRVVDRGYAVVVVAEGVCPRGAAADKVRERVVSRDLDPDNETDPEVHSAYQEERLAVLKAEFKNRFDEFRNKQHRVFVVEPRYLIRAIPASAVDQIYCQRLSDMAVHNALAGFTDFMISQWLTEYVLVPLRLVAKGHKSIPPGGVFWSTVITGTKQPSFV